MEMLMMLETLRVNDDYLWRINVRQSRFYRRRLATDQQFGMTIPHSEFPLIWTSSTSAGPKRSIPLEELTLLCQEQLEVMSKKRIRRILAGEESANISSSGTEDDTSDEEAALEGKCVSVCVGRGRLEVFSHQDVTGSSLASTG
ncbi:hypothetical protein ElyMa_000302200 [Elysia marginata]|uniref:Uncharacterized protein n=1 Tax=Elysia marginata TaxID=1093978 RepID=A0AAV4FAM5_9GAST|nr:hypothetical protein ElyMa_000302200 [Elysia marginata]